MNGMEGCSRTRGERLADSAGIGDGEGIKDGMRSKACSSSFRSPVRSNAVQWWAPAAEKVRYTEPSSTTTRDIGSRKLAGSQPKAVGCESSGRIMDHADPDFTVPGRGSGAAPS